MNIRKLTATVAVALFGVLALGAVSASATTTLVTDPSGGLLTGSTTISNSGSTAATLSLTGVGEIVCSNTRFDADVNANQSATSITGTLTQLTFTTCTDTVPVLTITSCHLVPNATGQFPIIHITATGANTHTQLLTDPTVRCNIAGSATSFCYYTAHTATGLGTNTPNAVTFNVPVVTNVAGSGSLGAACGASGAAGSFHVGLTDAVQGGTGNRVTVSNN